MKRTLNRGFTLIELVMTIALLSILAVLAVDRVASNLDEERFEDTLRRMKDIRKGLVGDPAIKTGALRTSFGYIGDVGGIPTAVQGIAALTANPGVPVGGWAMDATTRIGLGWNGPYLKAGDSGTDYTKDAWGTNFVYSPAAVPPTLVSLGADRWRRSQSRHHNADSGKRETGHGLRRYYECGRSMEWKRAGRAQLPERLRRPYTNNR
jgi:prepilin-type N-terminal cleavage/methylation domain-containing protein